MEHRNSRKSLAGAVLSVAFIVFAFVLMQLFFGEQPYQAKAREAVEANLGDDFYLVAGFSEDELLEHHLHLLDHPAIIRRDTLGSEIVMMAIVGKYHNNVVQALPIKEGISTGSLYIGYSRVNETPFLNLYRQKISKYTPSSESGGYVFADTIKYFWGEDKRVKLSEYSTRLPDSATTSKGFALIRGNWDHVF